MSIPVLDTLLRLHSGAHGERHVPELLHAVEVLLRTAARSAAPGVQLQHWPHRADVVNHLSFEDSLKLGCELELFPKGTPTVVQERFVKALTAGQREGESLSHVSVPFNTWMMFLTIICSGRSEGGMKDVTHRVHNVFWAMEEHETGVLTRADVKRCVGHLVSAARAGAVLLEGEQSTSPQDGLSEGVLESIIMSEYDAMEGGPEGEAAGVDSGQLLAIGMLAANRCAQMIADDALEGASGESRGSKAAPNTLAEKLHTALGTDTATSVIQSMRGALSKYIPGDKLDSLAEKASKMISAAQSGGDARSKEQTMPAQASRGRPSSTGLTALMESMEEGVPAQFDGGEEESEGRSGDSILHSSVGALSVSLGDDAGSDADNASNVSRSPLFEGVRLPDKITAAFVEDIEEEARAAAAIATTEVKAESDAREQAQPKLLPQMLAIVTDIGGKLFLLGATRLLLTLVLLLGNIALVVFLHVRLTLPLEVALVAALGMDVLIAGLALLLVLRSDRHSLEAGEFEDEEDMATSMMTKVLPPSLRNAAKSLMKMGTTSGEGAAIQRSISRLNSRSGRPGQGAAAQPAQTAGTQLLNRVSPLLKVLGDKLSSK